MKKSLLLVLMLAGLVSPIYSQYDIEENLNLGRTGLWIGPIAAFPGTALGDTLQTQVGGGGFFRFNFPSNDFMIEVHASYQKYLAYDIATLELIPFGAGLTYKLPIDFSIEFFVRATLGGAYVTNTPAMKSNLLPMANLGVEFSFPTGPMMNVGLRIDYLFIYESYLTPPAGAVNYNMADGHFLNFGLMLNFDIPTK